jgi:hypothetical protein
MTVPLRAEEPDFERTLNEAIEKLRPEARAAGSFGRWTDPRTYDWINPTTFRGPFGLMLDASCAPTEGIRPPQAPAKFLAAVKEMQARVQWCARTRILPATVGLIYGRMPKTRVRCDPKDCTYDDPTIHASACSYEDASLITFKDLGAYPDPSSLFHELLHLTKHVDNQALDDHAHPKKHPLRDEVYFWEKHCFDQTRLVDDMREELSARVGAARLSLEKQADLLKVHQLALEVCATPFRYNVQLSRPVFTGPEVEAVCRQYAQYLMMEINLGHAMNSTLMPLVLACDPARDRIACPSADLFNASSAAAKRLAAYGVVFPPNPAQYTPEVFSACISAN